METWSKRQNVLGTIVAQQIADWCLEMLGWSYRARAASSDVVWSCRCSLSSFGRRNCKPPVLSRVRSASKDKCFSMRQPESSLGRRAGVYKETLLRGLYPYDCVQFTLLWVVWVGRQGVLDDAPNPPAVDRQPQSVPNSIPKAEGARWCGAEGRCCAVHSSSQTG